jgi:hypothetical protein
VSLSYLWVSAFPGIEWSRSLREAGQYALARLLPSAETRALRRSYAAAQPLVSGGTWAQTSQTHRIARYLLSRPARQETIQPVLRALERWPATRTAGHHASTDTISQAVRTRAIKPFARTR